MVFVFCYLKWQSNKTLASVGLTQACPNYQMQCAIEVSNTGCYSVWSVYSNSVTLLCCFIQRMQMRCIYTVSSWSRHSNVLVCRKSVLVCFSWLTRYCRIIALIFVPRCNSNGRQCQQWSNLWLHWDLELQTTYKIWNITF